MDRPVITRDSGFRDVEVWCAHHQADTLLACLTSLLSYLNEERGCAQPPTMFLEKEGIAPGRWIKRVSAAEAGADRPAGRAHPCDHILLSWNIASWSSFPETSQLIRLVAGLCLCCLARGTCVFHQPEQTPEPVLTTSSTELFLQSCDSKEPKRLSEAGS